MSELERNLRDGVLVLVLNREKSLNALTEGLLAELQKALKEAAKEEAVRAVLLTGAGRAFSAGQDLAEVKEGTSYREVLARYIPVVEAMVRLEKPVVAAVNGVAAGAGMSLALAADLRVMAEGAFFMTAFAKIGLVPDAGMSYFLPRLVGYARAFDLVFRSPRVSAEEARAWGLVSEVFPDEGFFDAAFAFARELAEGPTRAYALAKRALWKNAEATLGEALAYEAYMQELAGRSEDHKEGVQAFREKRPPRFLGR